MKKSMKTKKKLLMSILALVLSVSMLLGTTLAWFTDSVTSGKNTITAGNLDIEITHSNGSVTNENIEGKTDIFQISLWEPGAVVYENFTVKNVGSLAFKTNVGLAIADYNAVQGTSKTLKDVLKVKVLEGSNIIASPSRENVMALDWTTSQSIDDFKWENGELYPVGTSGKDSEKTFQVIMYWQPSDVDNDYNMNNGKNTTDGNPLFIEFGINAVASQLQYESDSFNNEYDKDTIIPVLPKSIDKQFVSAPISGKTYDGTESVKVVNKNDQDSTVASVPAPAVKSIVENLATGIETKQGTDVNTVLILSVTTNTTTEVYASYNIELTATMNYTDTAGLLQTKSLDAQQVDALLGSNIVDAKVNIGAGLNNVNVRHAGADMPKLSSASENAVGFFYEKNTGVLTIKTSSFSPFEVTYTLPEVVKEIKVSDGTKDGFMLFTEFHDSVNDGETYAGKTVTLLTNIDINDNAYAPMKDFRGMFDGGNKTITLNTDQSSNNSSEIALFEDITSGTVKNLNIAGNIKAGKYAASLAIKIHTNEKDDGAAGSNVTLQNITNTANVTAPRKVAGIVANAYGYGGATAVIDACVNRGKLTETGTSNTNVIGGIVSYTQANTMFTNCKNFGDISFTGTQSIYGAGGIVGCLNYSVVDSVNEVSNCYNYGNLSETQASAGSIAGIIGRYGNGNGLDPANITMKMSNSYDYGTVTMSAGGTDKHAGSFFASIADRVANANNQAGITFQVSGTLISHPFDHFTPHRPNYDSFITGEGWTKQTNQIIESEGKSYTVTIWSNEI